MLLGCLLLAQGALAQTTPAVETSGPEVRLELGGIVQPRLSYGWVDEDETSVEERRERIGFGVRRVRLRATATLAERAGVFIQLEGASGNMQVLDAYAFYNLNSSVRLRVGRMVSAEPRALILTPASVIDAVDRAAIAEIWGRGTLGSDGRDFGLDVRFQTAQGEALLFVHNGDGAWSRLRGNYREGISGGQPTGGLEVGLDDLAVSFYTALRPKRFPGIEIGGFASYNGSANPNTVITLTSTETIGRRYLSYAAHLYWGATPGSQRFRLKADVIGLRYENTDLAPRLFRDQHTVGAALLGALRLHRAAELFVRFEQYDRNVNNMGDGDVYLTGGFSLSPSRLRGGSFSRERLTLGYSVLFPEDRNEPERHLLILQAQVAF